MTSQLFLPSVRWRHNLFYLPHDDVTTYYLLCDDVTTCWPSNVMMSHFFKFGHDDITTSLTLYVMMSQLVQHPMWWHHNFFLIWTWWHHNLFNIICNDVTTCWTSNVMTSQFFLVWTWWHHNLFNIVCDDVTTCWTSYVMMAQLVLPSMWWHNNLFNIRCDDVTTFDVTGRGQKKVLLQYFFPAFTDFAVFTTITFRFYSFTAVQFAVCHCQTRAP
jgi:hypothetical protein